MRSENQKNKPEILSRKETQVIVTLPDSVTIQLVQANELHHYELYQWLVALLAPVAVGFWTAYFLGEKNQSLLWSAIVFSIIAILFFFIALYFRRKVFRGSIKKTATLDE